MKLNIGVFFGGRSVEHEVSVISALQALKNIDMEKYNAFPVYMTKNNEFYIGNDLSEIENFKDIPALLKKSQRAILVNEEDACFITPYPPSPFKKKIRLDLALPIVHGTNVEDGTLQGFFSTMGLPYAGCDILSSALGMDKYIMKAVLKEKGIPLLDAEVFTLSDYEEDKIISLVEKKFSYPVIVKPVNLGSSVGIAVSKDRNELSENLDNAFRYSERVLVEKAVTRLREINCACLGDENEAIASECEEPLHTKDILTYQDKYVQNSKTSGKSGMASLQRRIPAEIPAELREEIRSLAVKSFRALGCSGVARIDFIIDEEDGSLYFNEINTIPGSLSFYLWESSGLQYKDLLDRIIDLAMKRKRSRDTLTFTFDTNILKTASFGKKTGKL